MCNTCVAGAGHENKSTIGSDETKNGLLTEAIVPFTGLLTLAWEDSYCYKKIILKTRLLNYLVLV